MTTTQAAKKLGLTTQTVKRHIRRGRLEATWEKDQFGRGHYEITRAALKEFQDNYTPPGNPKWKRKK